MWALTNQTAFAAERCWSRDRDGAEVWLVGVKATYEVGPDGTCHLSSDQVPVHRHPVFRGAPESSSLANDLDLVQGKSATDVLVRGSAYSHAGPVESLDVGFRIGTLVRRATVYGDRWWQSGFGGLRASRPERFTSMELTWENAFGGGAAAAAPGAVVLNWPFNPVGRGFYRSESEAANQRLPNIEHSDHPIRRWSDRPPSFGFGIVARHWKPRCDFAGTYDDEWEASRYPLLPEDFDYRYQQSALAEQQVPGFLRGGEQVVLVNLARTSEHLVFRLPAAYLTFTTLFTDSTSEVHRARLSTVVIDADGPRVSLLWLSELPCHPKVHRLQETLVEAKPVVPLGGRAGLPVLVEPDDEPTLAD